MTRLLEKNGWAVEKEKDDIDLVAKSNGRVVAIEVETGRNNRSQIQKNIEKLIGFEAALKLVITTNKEAFSKIQALLKEINPAKHSSRDVRQGIPKAPPSLISRSHHPQINACRMTIKSARNRRLKYRRMTKNSDVGATALNA